MSTGWHRNSWPGPAAPQEFIPRSNEIFLQLGQCVSVRSCANTGYAVGPLFSREVDITQWVLQHLYALAFPCPPQLGRLRHDFKGARVMDLPGTAFTAMQIEVPLPQSSFSKRNWFVGQPPSWEGAFRQTKVDNSAYFRCTILQSTKNSSPYSPFGSNK